jgi:hypothetical protein
MTDTSTIRKLERIALQLRFDLIEMIGEGKFGHLGRLKLARRDRSLPLFPRNAL